MKNIIKSIGDLRVSVVLFLLFALFCALATFIESAYGTPTAWAMVYDTFWFEYIQLLLGINLLCGMFRYKMFGLKKLPLMIFHISFLFILVGSAMTRYAGFEGILPIREHTQNSLIESSKTSLRISAIKDGERYSAVNDRYIGNLPFANSFKLKLNLGDDQAVLKYKDLILNAHYTYKENNNSDPLLVLMLSQKGSQGVDVKFEKGEVKNIEGVNFAFMNDNVKAPFVKIDENLTLSSSENLHFLSMLDGQNLDLKIGEKANAKERRLYEIKDISFVVKAASLHAQEALEGSNRPQDESFWLWFKSAWLEVGRTMLISTFGEPQNWKNSLLLHFKDFALSNENKNLELTGSNALKLELSYKNESKEFYIFEYNKPIMIELAGQKFFISWALSYEQLPFDIYLRDFVLDRYPGSMSPASYASEITVKNNNENFDYRIFMNNVLDYDGYRFYQSSYDQDEKGTVLSVNKDPGKIPTYIGYFLLCLGMFMNFLNPHSRFRTLARLINKDTLKHTSVIISILLLSFGSEKTFAQDLNSTLPVVNTNHAKALATLIVQKSADGRMVPFDTLSREILEKIHQSDSYKGQNSNAVMLSMLVDVDKWQMEPFILMPQNQAVRDAIANILEIPSAKYISYKDFFDENNRYKLQKYVENANRKNPNARGVFDKEIIKLDERANVVNLVFSGELFKFIPVQNNPNNVWLAPFSAVTTLKGDEGHIVLALIQNYFSAVENAFKDGNWTRADEGLKFIKEYQEKIGYKVMPSKTKVEMEIFSNKAEIFVKLAPVYLIAGFLLLILVFSKMVVPNLKISFIFKVVYVLNVLAFVIHTVGLGLRAYLSGHAPWSNGYESMVYIAWALSLSGIFFSRKSPIALSLTSILSGVVLMVAHLSEMNPQITNLVPVLNSYWLSIHVSVITASYGFLGLCALLGIFTLFLMCFLKKDGKYNLNILRNITEATRINEMAMIFGLCLLTVGNFLGAIWANESWGRYWSWDSKETWALVSILVYAAILHLRMIPKYCNQFVFALWSMFAYWVIIMTYFGVNYFLTGLHSYAAGEAAQIPNYVYWGFALMVVLALFARRKRNFVGKL
ncbi:cytochrome c biogenesis protein CcsA [Campylobacter jejuni]|uniref:Cytochrome C biogenesis protein n=5 Tax=Campylobacter jejuni TaxID=197 RepID=A0A620L4B8_CAMJU|nr:cytochrome c biogenesis protein CcsA [Campylobacter jejuni]ETN90826.1 cytochrome C biogenesis protein [Campylobacter jejuni subsp. jejuni 81-176-UMCW9]ANS24102.1 cytochrome c biogenesis protein [Campylobacter jejuni subsp. jejuni]AOW97318.1 cytochrome c biogenesis protein [Campylobacter jejuni subsp. jejuni str. RM3420]ASI87528.1 Putative cytochrome C-type biogenesis protein [Campylobacter jejuni]ASN50018.1 cytochrome C biogenesis protein [Campylobacter jejuni]